jgi:hypothetical protein
MQTNGSIKERPGYLCVDCERGGPREVAQLYRDFAVACVEKQASRALLKAAEGDAETHRPLRDAFRVMVLAGIPAEFKVAFVTRALDTEKVLRELRRYLRDLQFDAAVFRDESEAVEWLSNVRVRKHAEAAYA